MFDWAKLTNMAESREILAQRYRKLLLIISLVLFFLWFAFGPVLKSRVLLRLLLDEDRIVENLSALAYLGAIVVSICWIRRFSNPGISRWYWVLPLLSLFCLLEEISFGYNFHRYFKRKNIYGVNIDAIHDFFSVASNVIQDKIPIYVVLIFSALILFILGFLFFYFRHDIYKVLKNHPAFGYVIIGIACGMVATLIDLPFMESKRTTFGFLFFMEELLELVMAVSILFAAYALPFSKMQESEPPDPDGNVRE